MPKSDLSQGQDSAARAKRLRPYIPHNELPAAAHSAPGIPPLGREDCTPLVAMKQNNSTICTVTAAGGRRGATLRHGRLHPWAERRRWGEIPPMPPRWGKIPPMPQPVYPRAKQELGPDL